MAMQLEEVMPMQNESLANQGQGGLLNRNEGDDTGGPGQEVPIVGGAEQEEGGVSEKEQEMYNNIVAGGVALMSSEKGNKDMINTLKNGAAKPVEALAKVALMTAMAVSEKVGNNLPREIFLPAAVEILEQVANFAVKAGVFEVDQKILNDASVMMVTGLMEHLGYSQEDIMQEQENAPDDVKEMVGANQQQAEPEQQPAPGGLLKRQV